MNETPAKIPAALRAKNDDRHKNTFGNRARFFGRALGLFALVGLIMSGLSLSDVLTAADPVGTIRGLLEATEHSVLSVSAWVFVVCTAIVLVLLIVEVIAAFVLVAFGRTLLGVNALLQIGLAIALLVIVNLVSRTTAERFDLTRDARFTLSNELLADLKRLRADSPTTIVVLRQSKPAGLLTDQADAYDNAAEAKVVEKVNDLVGQLREFGPRFNVVVLDTKDTGYDRALRDLTRRRPGLAEALGKAPENSIFFYADEKVQLKSRVEGTRLSTGIGPRPAVLTDPDDADKSLVYPATIARLAFRDFYQLDKTASKEATTVERERAAAIVGGVAFGPGAIGGGNLVLIPRGPEVFVRKLLTLEERKPRVGLAVIHPLLTSRESIDEYSSSGMRAALERNGFEVTDIILKKWSRGGPPTPAATTYEESELDRGEARYNLLTLAVANRESLIRELVKDLKTVETAIAKADAAKTNDEKRTALTDAARALQGYVRGRIQSEAQVRQVFGDLKPKLEEFKVELVELQPQLTEAGDNYRELLRDERSVESRRTVDVKAKLKAYVDDCDILIVPRLTVTDIVRGDVIPPAIFNLSKDQAEVVQEFMKAGKPVLFAFGPPVGEGRNGPAEGPDDVEKLLPQFGILLGRQTILTDEEATAIGERAGQEFGVAVKPTPLIFDIPEVAGKAANPIGAAYRTTARSVDRKLELRKGGHRPIDLAPGVAERSAFDPTILTTGPTSFNEDSPLAGEDSPPKFEPAKTDDPKRGTREEERRGPFVVGVALEISVPADWMAAKDATGIKLVDQEAIAALALPFDGGISAALLSAAADLTKRPKVRVAVYGHGGLFAGKTIDAAQETLLVHTLNWQLKRDERLPSNKPEAEKWRYPRADLTPTHARLWRQGLLLVLPACAAVLGITVLMLRKVR